jgi:acetyl-CoA carboxylase carboxyltransferase component
LAATSSRFAGRKEGELKVLATQRGHSVIYLTALARIDGRVVGLVANQPMFNAGAMDTDGIDKVISFLCHCDSFNIPLLFFHDIPGFLVGKEAEMRVETESASINWQTGRPNFRR